MQIQMRDTNHLWILLGCGSAEDVREVIIDKEFNDIRICDGSSVLRVRFQPNKKLKDVLLNDIFLSTDPMQ